MEKIIGKQPKKIIGAAPDGASLTLDKKISDAIDFIRRIASKKPNLFVAYSGGKDSEVLLDLFRRARVDYSGFYNSTTIDPPKTINWVKSHEDVIIMQPAVSFYQLIERRGLPSFARRFCCAKLKERFVAENVFVGVRVEESSNRAKKYKEPEVCFNYRHGRKGRHYLPLLTWTNNDIELYVNNNKLPCHPLYYDNDGKFCVNRRLGCLGCPLPYNRSIDDFRKYPNMIRAWCRALAVYRNTRTKPQLGVTRFKDEYENFLCNLTCRNYSDFLEKVRGLFPINSRDYLQDEFHVKLPEPQSDLDDIKKRWEQSPSL